MTFNLRLTAIGFTVAGLAAAIVAFAAEHSLHHYPPAISAPGRRQDPGEQPCRRMGRYLAIHSEEGILDIPRRAIVIQLK